MNTPSDRRKENIEAIAAVSPLQQGMLFHALRSKEHDPYFYQLVFALRGRLDVAALERAWQWAVDRHQVLRADYRWEETATPLAVIYKQRKVLLERLDFSAQDESAQLERLRQLLGEERAAGYDFRNAAGVSVRLIALGPELHWLTWSYHHVTLDGWSMSLVLSDTFAFYQQLERGDTTAPRPALAFTAYLHWLHEQDQSQAVGYWKALLGDFEAPTPLPLDSAGGEVSYAEQAVELSSADSERLKEAARRAGVTLNTLVQGAWALLLARHANESRVVFGSTVSGRALDLPEIEAAAGLFINTLPIQVPLRSALTVQQFLSELQEQNVNSRNYEHTPLVEIRRAAGVSGDAGLFDSVVVFDNYPVDEVLKSQPAALRVEQVLLFTEELAESGGRNNYSLTLNVIVGSRIKLTLAYRSDRFRSERIAGLREALRDLLFRLADAPSERIGNIGLQAIAGPSTAAGASTAQQSSASPLLLEAFAAHVARTPDALAVRCDERAYSFAELARVSDRVARRLVAQGVGTDDKVGLCAERSSAFVALLLGILKAGAAYVPLDPKLPAARLSELARESGARLVVASERGAASVRDAQLSVESLPELLAASDDARPLPRGLHPEQAAYVIFTSGSTGKPKGVVVSHGALARYVNGLLARLELGAGASMGMVSTIAADLGHTVLFGALAAGVPLHLIAEERAFDPDAFAEVMSRDAIGVLKIVPSHLRALLHASDPARALPAHALIVGGEASDWALLEQVQRLKPGCRVINHYGPTETTV
ncbi:MAG: condensation domain-containing protein, partial [Polyangiaceae bacterium]